MDQLRLACPDDLVSRVQAGRVRALLEARPDALAVVEMVYKSCPDPESQAGILATSLDRHEAEVALVSVEHLPAHLPPGVRVGALLRDRGSSYRCASTNRPEFEDLPAGSRVAACDAVARAQLLNRYPGLEVDLVQPSEGLLERLKGGEWSAACVPAELLETPSAGHLECEVVSFTEVLPAVGKGAVAILVNQSRRLPHDLVGPLNDAELQLLLRAERAFVLDCAAGAGEVCTARATCNAEQVFIEGLFAEVGGSWLVREKASAPLRLSEVAARDLAAQCLQQAEPARRQGEPEA